MLLEQRGIPFEEIHVDDDPGFRERLEELTGGWTVPQIVIDGKPIGGYTELGSSTAPASSPRSSPPRPLAGRAVPRAAAGDAVFAIGVPQRSHGSPSRP